MKYFVFLLLCALCILPAISLAAPLGKATSSAIVFRASDDSINTGQLKKIIEKEIATEPMDNMDRPSSTKMNILSYSFGTVLITIIRMPAPVAGSEFQNAVAATQWQEAHDVLRKQKAQLIINVISTKISSVENKLILTKLVAAVLKSCNSLGVYWRDSQMLFSPENYQSMVAKADSKHLPLALWLNFTPQHTPMGTYNVHSVGLKAFDLPEYEMLGIKIDAWQEHLSFFLQTAARQLANLNKQLKDGDVLSSASGTKYSVAYTQSEMTRDSSVVRFSR